MITSSHRQSLAFCTGVMVPWSRMPWDQKNSNQMVLQRRSANCAMNHFQALSCNQCPWIVFRSCIEPSKAFARCSCGRPMVAPKALAIVATWVWYDSENHRENRERYIPRGSQQLLLVVDSTANVKSHRLFLQMVTVKVARLWNVDECCKYKQDTILRWRTGCASAMVTMLGTTWIMGSCSHLWTRDSLSISSTNGTRDPRVECREPILYVSQEEGWGWKRGGPSPSREWKRTSSASVRNLTSCLDMNYISSHATIRYFKRLILYDFTFQTFREDHRYLIRHISALSGFPPSAIRGDWHLPPSVQTQPVQTSSKAIKDAFGMLIEHWRTWRYKFRLGNIRILAISISVAPFDISLWQVQLPQLLFKDHGSHSGKSCLAWSLQHSQILG